MPSVPRIQKVKSLFQTAGMVTCSDHTQYTSRVDRSRPFQIIIIIIIITKERYRVFCVDRHKNDNLVAWQQWSCAAHNAAADWMATREPDERHSQT